MKDKVVGTYRLGTHNVKLVLRQGTGGGFDLAPKNHSLPKISIGVDDKLEYAIHALIHEALEVALAQSRLRYDRSDDSTWDADRYVFIFKHQDLAHVSIVVGGFIYACYADLKKAWLEFKRKPKKKPKRRKK